MTNQGKTIRVLCVGCGNMGRSHAQAYQALADQGFQLVGLVSRGAKSREALAKALGNPPGLQLYDDYEKALLAAKPDAVCISTYPDTHARYAMMALKAGAHVFVEKPLAETVAECEEIARTAQEVNRKLVVGYILRQHPSWQKFVEIARTLGKPLVMRMNLNQQSHGDTWHTHKMLMQSMSPIVDCGVHYIDMMCLMTRAKPVRVYAIGARLSDELPKGMYNYGQLQVTFDDGSVGWYEAGWGPMMSTEAYFVKDVIGPKGCVSIVGGDEKAEGSDEVDSHIQTNRLRHHRSETDDTGAFKHADEIINTQDEPDHQGLCTREQAYFLRAIQDDLDLSEHHQDVINSLRVVLAADKAARTGQVVPL